jgi:acyl carrier protein
MEDINKQLEVEAFLGILCSHLKQIGDSGGLTMESNLYMLGLDSMAAVNLLFELEETFGVVFPDSFLTESTFETPTALKSAIISLICCDSGGGTL